MGSRSGTGSGVFERFDAGASERPVPPLPEEGDLAGYPVPLLVSIAAYDHATGILDLDTRSDAGALERRRLYVKGGLPIFIQSNVESETAAAVLAERGRISAADLDRCRKYMATQGRTLQQALLELSLATEADLRTAYRMLPPKLFPALMKLTQGHFRWRATDEFVGKVPEGQLDTATLLFRGIAEFTPPRFMKTMFEDRQDLPLAKTSLFEDLEAAYRAVFPSSTLVGKIDGTTTVRNVLRAAGGDPRTQLLELYALAMTGMVTFPELSTGAALELAVSAAVLEASEPEGGLDSLEFVSGDISPVSLGLAEAPALNPVRSSARAEPTRPPTPRAEPTRPPTAARGEPTRPPAGGPTGSGRVSVLPGARSKADQLVESGRVLLVRNDLFGAKSNFERALAEVPSYPPARAYLGWVSYVINRADLLAAVTHLRGAVEQDPNLAIAHQFLGKICLETGKPAEAKRWFGQCLQLDPANVEAKRGLSEIDRARGPSGVKR